MGKVVLLAGGGGHTSYAYALAQHLDGKCEIESIVPEGDELSYAKLKRFGLVNTLPKPRGPKTSLAPFLAGLGVSLIRSSSLKLGSDTITVSTGSNFCVSPCIKAWTKGSPIINIESSVRLVKPSKTAKYLYRIASLTALQWPEQKEFFPKGEVFGPIFARKEIEARNDGYVLVTGGTYGHKSLIETLDATGLENVFLQAGPHYSPEYAKKHPSWKVIPYSDRFHEIIAGASVVVTHLGDTVLESALVYGKPTVMVLNPEWTRTGGPEDARILAKKINVILLEQLTAKDLLEAIERAPTIEIRSTTNGAELLSRRLLEMLRA
jgi:UDP-N-acetylglucosamine:LPS N-acetylglucosamine transferase